MKITKLIAPLFLALAVQAQATEVCPKGAGMLNPGEPCIPTQLLNYLYCLNKSGSGKIEITQTSGNSSKKQTEISLNGKGSGVFLSGEAGGRYKNEEASRATKEIQEKLDPSLAANCKALATPTKNQSDNNSGKDSNTAGKQPSRQQETRRDINSRQIQTVIESVDFLEGKPELTERSLAYLSKLGKDFSKIGTATIILVPEYRNQSQFDEDRLNENIESRMSLKRQIAVRNALVAAGFPSDSISLEQGTASFANRGIRFDDSGRRIESGLMVQVWP